MHIAEQAVEVFWLLILGLHVGTKVWRVEQCGVADPFHGVEKTRSQEESHRIELRM